MFTRRRPRKRSLEKGESMAKPMTPTPPVTGDIARRIEKELRNGTPNTPERVATIKRAVPQSSP